MHPHSPRLRALTSLAALVVMGAALGGCPWQDEYPVQQFIDDLYLSVAPRPAHAGERIEVFVNGEPPARLEAGRRFELTASDGTSVTLRSGRGPHVRLQARQVLRLPAGLESGSYLLEGKIFERRGERTGTPERRFYVVG